MKTWWFSSLRMTVKVATRDGVIVEAAPIVRKFIGQRGQDLVAWMKTHGGFKWAQLETTAQG